MFKRLTKQCVLKILLFIDLFFEKKFFRVFLYHQVTNKHKASTAVAVESFAEQMHFLHQQGYKSALMKDIIGFIDGSNTNYKKIAITFDDGYADNLHTAAPLMIKYDYKGIVFVATKYIDTIGKLGNESDKIMDASELIKLESMGWDVCNHFHSHQKLTQLSPDAINDEVEKSKSILEKIITKKNNSSYFALPKNRYNNEVVKILEKINGLFFIGRGITRRNNSNLFIYRIEINNTDDYLKFKLKTTISYNLIKQLFRK